jgi:RNA polymerase sigma-70 factor, ECF subfamily
MAEVGHPALLATVDRLQSRLVPAGPVEALAVTRSGKGTSGHRPDGEGMAVGEVVDDDAVLMARVAAGDEDAYRQLIGRYLPRLLVVARRILNDAAEAEDVVQETCLKLWRLAPKLEVGPRGIGGWLRQVCRNRCIDVIRSSRTTTVTDEVPEQSEPALQVERLEDADLGRRVNAVVLGLPDRQRLALTLFHYEGLSLSETGDIMGASVEAVESLLSRARRRLKAELKDEWKGLLER